MKKTYQAPQLCIVDIHGGCVMQPASATGLDGFEGNGGKATSLDADSRSFDFDWSDDDFGEDF
jgi:hypothetical protein